MQLLLLMLHLLPSNLVLTYKSRVAPAFIGSLFSYKQSIRLKTVRKLSNFFPTGNFI